MFQKIGHNLGGGFDEGVRKGTCDPGIGNSHTVLKSVFSDDLMQASMK